MAINIIEYNIMRRMRQELMLPLGGDILELGEANWYGDVDLNLLLQDIGNFAPADQQAKLRAQLQEAVEANRPGVLWEIAKVYWQAFLQPASMTAIDFHGTDKALKLDLNSPIKLKRQFHIVMNGGTLEHVFNVAQAFKTIHDHTRPGGFMLHGFPFTGWVDHGFYGFNPTFVWDLAASNDYRVCLFVYSEVNPPKIVPLTAREQILHMAKEGQIGQNSMLYVTLRRPDEEKSFRIPMQGFYAGSVSQEAAQAWKTLR
jgi:hypothetical protein